MISFLCSLSTSTAKRGEAAARMMVATPVPISNGLGQTTVSGGAALSPTLSRGHTRVDDIEPLLMSNSPPMPKRSRLKTCLVRLSQSRVLASIIAVLSFTGGVTWIVKGLCICLGMMLMGGVGSFTLHQMMSPQIESLLRQRSELQQQIEALRNQVDNVTRIANSRLDMIHLLEQELERQAVAAVSVGPMLNNTNTISNSHHFGAHGLLKANFWSTVAHAWLLGAFVFTAVGYRIYCIARSENQRVQKARSSSDMDASIAFPSNHRPTLAVSSQVADVDHAETGLLVLPAAAAASSPLESSSPSERNAELSGKCYKRAPGLESKMRGPSHPFHLAGEASPKDALPNSQKRTMDGESLCSLWSPRVAIVSLHTRKRLAPATRPHHPLTANRLVFMLQVLHAGSPGFEPRAKKDVESNGFPLVIDAGQLELIDDDPPTDQTESVTADAGIIGDEDVVADDEYEDYGDDSDSDYRPEESGSDEDDEEAGDDTYVQSIETQLDEQADEVSDFYLKRMLEERDQLQGDDTAWVDKYIKAQQQWKERHGSSIDEIDLDLRLAESRSLAKTLKKKKTKKIKTLKGTKDCLLQRQLKTIVEAWNGRVSPRLPPALLQYPTELVLSLLGASVFVAIALVVQFFVIFRSPRYT